jgi:hypothetical protein
LWIIFGHSIKCKYNFIFRVVFSVVICSICIFVCSLSYHYAHSGRHCHSDAYNYTLKAADYAISKGAYLNGLDLLKHAGELCKSENEYKLVIQVANKAIKDMCRMSAKRTSRATSTRIPHSMASLDAEDGGPVRSPGNMLVDIQQYSFAATLERDFIAEYKKFKLSMEANQAVDPAQSMHMAGPSLMRKSVSLFSSAFGDLEDKSTKGQFNFQLSYTAPNENLTKEGNSKDGKDNPRSGAVSRRVGASKDKEVAPVSTGCQCAIS